MRSSFTRCDGFGRATLPYNRMRRGRRRHVAPIPPASAQRLKQSRRIGVPSGLRLGESDQCLLLGSLSVQKRQVGNGAGFELLARQRKAVIRRARGTLLGFERNGIL